MVLDNGPIHALGDNYENIEFAYLPPYSPQFNPIEFLWKQLKVKHLHNRLFRTKVEFHKFLTRGLEQFRHNPQDNLSLMSKWRKVAKAKKLIKQV